MKIRSKLTLNMTILILISIVAVGVLTYRSSSQIILDQTENSALELTKTESSTIQGLFENIKLQPKYLTYDKSVLDFLNDQANVSKKQAVDKLLGQYGSENKDQLDNMLLTNAGGTFVSLSQSQQLLGKKISQMPLVESALATQKIQVSQTYVSPATGKMVVMILNPVIDFETNQVIGTIGTPIYAASMAKYLKDVKLNGIASSYAYLIDENGNYIYTPQADQIGKPVKIPELKSVSETISKGEKVDAATLHYNEGGQEKLAAYSVIPGTNWLLVMAANKADIQAPIAKMSHNILLMGLLIILIAAVIAYISAQKIAAPIMAVTELINRTGKLDLVNDESFTWLLKNKDETGAMSQAIVNMRAALREIIDILLQSSNDINGNATGIEQIVEKIYQDSSESSAATEQLAAGMEESAASTEEINASIEEVESNVKVIVNKTLEGKELSTQIIARATGLKNDVTALNENGKVIYDDVKRKLEGAIDRLKAVEQINVLADSILGITAQTNLLALNAAIEAARAGEAGRGFAVVSEEIRKLAEQSSSTAGNIQKIVSEVHVAVSNMKSSTEQVLQFLERDLPKNYEKFLHGSEQYNQDALLITDMMATISTSIDELAGTMNGISQAISNVAITVNESARGVNEIAENNSNLVIHIQEVGKDAKGNIQSARTLQSVVSKIKLN